MKKWIICLAAVIALSMLSACAGRKPAESQLPNPIEEYETLEDAQAAAGFEIPTPAGLPEGYALEAVTTIAKNTIQLIYTDGQNDLSYRAVRPTAPTSAAITTPTTRRKPPTSTGTPSS